MTCRAVQLIFRDGAEFDLVFEDGVVKRMDMAQLFGRYPVYSRLGDRDFFMTGALDASGVHWDDMIDIDAGYVYEHGEDTGKNVFPAQISAAAQIARVLTFAREYRRLSQKQLAEKTGIHQADISRIERGLANPTAATLDKLADALNAKLKIEFELKNVEVN